MAKTKILNLADAPEDPIRRAIWLAGVMEKAHAELDTAFADAYFEARLEGRLLDAVAAGPHSKKQALAYSRHANQKRGRSVRWGDGLDPTSTSR